MVGVINYSGHIGDRFFVDIKFTHFYKVMITIYYFIIHK